MKSASAVMRRRSDLYSYAAPTHRELVITSSVTDGLETLTEHAGMQNCAGKHPSTAALASQLPDLPR